RAFEFNQEFRYTAHTNLLNESSEHIYNDEFFEKQSAILSGVDNSKAREIMSNKAIFYRKPFFESGTKGLDCHSQVILPFATEVYKSNPDPVETGCSLRTPSKAEHCIQYALMKFSEAFNSNIDEINKFLANKEEYLKNLETCEDKTNKVE